MLFPLSSCSETPIIVDEICEITQEICYYANLVCENFQPPSSTFEKSNEIKPDLKQISIDLKNVLNNSDLMSNDMKIISRDNVKAQLVEIKNRLNIYNHGRYQKICRRICKPLCTRCRRIGKRS